MATEVFREKIKKFFLKDCPCYKQLLHDLSCTDYTTGEQLIMLLIPRQCDYKCENHCTNIERNAYCIGYNSCTKDAKRFICSDKTSNNTENTDGEKSDLDAKTDLDARTLDNDRVLMWTEWTDSIESHSLLDIFTQFQRF